MIPFGSCAFETVALGWIPSCWAHNAYSLHAGRSLKNQPNQQKAKNRHPFILKYIKKKKKKSVMRLPQFPCIYLLVIVYVLQNGVVENCRSGVI